MPAREDRGGLSGAAGALVFLAFVAVGSGWIVWAKLAAMPAAAVTLVPVAVMIAYAAAALVFRPGVGEDQSGDNAYYMGFLFTLTSLSVSLWQFRADGEAEEIVRNFGVAIASTIAGIALRVFINQLRRDPVTIERGARVDLADAARRMRRELDAVVLDLSHFRRGAQQSAAETFETARAEMAGSAGALAAAVEALSGHLDAHSERLAEVTRQLEVLERGLEMSPPSPSPNLDGEGSVPAPTIDGREEAEFGPSVDGRENGEEAIARRTDGEGNPIPGEEEIAR